jgi:tetratricopeptide (TPR) repeat protein
MRILGLFLSLALVSTAVGQDAGVESIFAFGAGARALALGRAFTSLGDDASCIYWNPASLPLLSQKELTSLHASLQEGTAYDFFGFSMPTRTLGGFGLGGINARTGGIEIRDIHNQRLGESDYSETEYLFAYGGRVPRLPLISRVLSPLYAGITGKLIHQSLAEYSAVGAGADIGILYTPRALRNLRLGVALQNVVSPTLKLKQASDELPLSVRGGVSVSSKLASGWGWLVALDLNKTGSKGIKFHSGAEVTVRDLVALRAGFDQGDFAVGFGLNYWKFGFDYAYLTRELGAIHCLSVSLRPGRTIQEDWIAVRKREAEERARKAEEERRAVIEKHSANAVTLYDSEDYLGALGEWQKVLGFDPEHSEARNWVERITSEIQRIQEGAIKDKELLALVNEHINAGIEFFTKGDYERSISEWNKVLESDPINMTAQEYLARTEALLAEAIADHEAEAARLEGEQKYGEALSEWKEVLRLDPENERGLRGVERVSTRIEEAHHINLGFQYFTAGEFDRAALEFRATLALNPENKTAVEYLRRSVGRKSLIEIAGDKEVWNLYLRGIEHFTRGEYKEAIEVWEEVLRLDPENENAVRNIEEARLRLKRTTGEPER